ncbi:MAG: transposase [Chloroflexota bacterium]|nr:transposase [Chloroflexota bacterium]
MQPLLPPCAKTGRPRADDRKTLEGILFVLRSGCRWQDLPRRYGAPTTVWRRLKTWQEDGTWLRRWRVVLGRLDAPGRLAWAYAFLDGVFAPAKKGATQSG